MLPYVVSAVYAMFGALRFVANPFALVAFVVGALVLVVLALAYVVVRLATG